MKLSSLRKKSKDCSNETFFSTHEQKHAILLIVLLPELCGPIITFTLFNVISMSFIGPMSVSYTHLTLPTIA